MRLALAFFLRDARIALSYRVSFAVQLLGNLLVLGVCYFVGKTVGRQAIPALAPYGGNFFAFLLVGIALADCVGVSITIFANQIREGQTTGTLEATLMSPAPLPIILIYSSIWAYFFSAIRFLLYLAMGVVLCGADLRAANLASGVVIFLLTVISFMGLGMLWAGIIMLMKRGESILTTLGYLVVLVSGVLFPANLLPRWLQRLASLIPLTHALEGMRLALLRGYGLGELTGILWKLLAFSAILVVAGLTSFQFALRIAKHTGSLTQY
jgi:ABC-2 type transport system permease protein